VHRLDKETSGCLVVAKNDATHVALSEQFAARTVGKVYYAIACGQVPLESGEIHAAIARHPTHRKRMAVTEEGEGRAAHTSYRRMELLNGATLVEARIHTGRTHQVRVHLQFLGFPVVGDETYGAKQNKILTELTGFVAPRVMLHSRELTIVHPVTGKTLVCTAPFPEDFQKALKTLQLVKPAPVKPRKSKK
jgi:23S rRNA pseudouridine1911/1915/1917 synthase